MDEYFSSLRESEKSIQRSERWLSQEHVEVPFPGNVKFETDGLSEYSKKILVWSAGEGRGVRNLNEIRVDFDNLEHTLSCCGSTWFLQSYNDNLI